MLVRKKTENQLRHAQKLEAVGRLTGGMAHDLNNILTVIMGHARLLAKKLPDYGVLSSHLQQILNASDKTRSVQTHKAQSVKNI